MFGSCPGNAQRAEELSKVLEFEVFASIDSSSHLCTILSESSVDAFLERAGQCLTAFKVEERYPLAGEGRVLVKFSCENAMAMLMPCESTGQPTAMERA